MKVKIDVQLFVNDEEISPEDVEFMYYDDPQYCTHRYKLIFSGDYIKKHFRFFKNGNDKKIDRNVTENFFWDVTDLKRLVKKPFSGKLKFFINTIDKIEATATQIIIEGGCIKIS